MDELPIKNGDFHDHYHLLPEELIMLIFQNNHQWTGCVGDIMGITIVINYITFIHLESMN